MEQGLTTIEAITNFIFVKDLPIKADLIIVSGSSHPQLAKKAVELYKSFAKKILFTGGFNPKINKKECDFGAEIAIDLGVSEKDILREGYSSNTKENAIESANLIKRQGLVYKTILLVCKLHHARRLKATFIRVFPKSRLLIIPIKDERNITRENWWKKKKKIDIVMGEVKKIGEYFLRGDLSLR